MLKSEGDDCEPGCIFRIVSPMRGRLGLADRLDTGLLGTDRGGVSNVATIQGRVRQSSPGQKTGAGEIVESCETR